MIPTIITDFSSEISHENVRQSSSEYYLLMLLFHFCIQKWTVSTPVPVKTLPPVDKFEIYSFG